MEAIISILFLSYVFASVNALAAARAQGKDWPESIKFMITWPHLLWQSR